MAIHWGKSIGMPVDGARLKYPGSMFQANRSMRRAGRSLAGKARRVFLRATHWDVLKYCSLNDLGKFSIDLAQRIGSNSVNGTNRL